jgi:hypothetical protein
MKIQIVTGDDERVPALAKRACVEVCFNLRVNFDHVHEFCHAET